MIKSVIWPTPIKAKLRSFRSPRFTRQESFDFIGQVVLEAEDLLTNPVLTKAYTEETGRYKGFSRVVIRRFKIYYRDTSDHIIIEAVLFPGQN